MTAFRHSDTQTLIQIEVGPAFGAQLEAVVLALSASKKIGVNDVLISWLQKGFQLVLDSQRPKTANTTSDMTRKKKKESLRALAWSWIPIAKRKEIVESLRGSSPPWDSHALAKVFDVKHSSMRALIVCVALYGFDNEDLHTFLSRKELRASQKHPKETP